MVERFIRLTCDMCGITKDFLNIRVLKLSDKIRSEKWGLSRDRRYCYCPKCRKLAVSVGRNGNKKMQPLFEKDKLLLEKILEEDRKRQEYIYKMECEEYM